MGEEIGERAVWALQDRIEDGALTPEERKAVSRLIGAIGALGDTDSPDQALGHWQHVRELLASAFDERPGGTQ